MDEQKQMKLLDIFRKILWPASSLDLHFVELYSALSVGGRRPARQQDGEGYLIVIYKCKNFLQKCCLLLQSVLDLGK